MTGRRAFGRVVTAGVGTAPHSATLLHRVHAPFVIGPPAGPSPWSLPDVPRLAGTSEQTSWLDTMVEIAGRARPRRQRQSWMAQ